MFRDPRTMIFISSHTRIVTPVATSLLQSVTPQFSLHEGYEYSRHHDRLWRKTRSINPEFPRCVGVDPNRNFGYKWAAGGSSMRACSSIYHGPEPFSEPETRAIRDFLLAHKDQVRRSEQWLPCVVYPSPPTIS